MTVVVAASLWRQTCCCPDTVTRVRTMLKRCCCSAVGSPVLRYSVNYHEQTQNIYFDKTDEIVKKKKNKDKETKLKKKQKNLYKKEKRKFADGTTLVRLITKNDESHYRKEVAFLTLWCMKTNLLLNVSKTEGIVFNNQRGHNQKPPTDHWRCCNGESEKHQILGGAQQWGPLLDHLPSWSHSTEERNHWEHPFQLHHWVGVGVNPTAH